MKKYRIENCGCDDTVCFNIELTDEELKLVIKLFEENNKRASYCCTPHLYDYDYYTTKKAVVVPCYCYECECSEEDTGHHKIYENQINFMVDKKTRIINRMTYGGKSSYYFNILQSQDYDLIYDLIKADLVVKVEE